jgi:DNA transformation protein
MTASPDFLEHLQDLLRSLGPVGVRRMFGGAGIYADGVMFALVDEDTLYFKVDDASRPAFESEGSAPFTYQTKNGPGALASYWRVPERLLDEPDDMSEWARKAVAVARRANAAKLKPGKDADARRGRR